MLVCFVSVFTCFWSGVGGQGSGIMLVWWWWSGLAQCAYISGCASGVFILVFYYFLVIRYDCYGLVSVGTLHWSGLVCFFWSRLVQGAIYWSLVVKSNGLYGGLCWSGGIVACTLKKGFVGLWYSGLVWYSLSLVWSCVFMVLWVDLVCCSYDGLHWSGWGDNVGLVGVFMVMCSGPGLWFWASSTHYHLRCSLQLHLGYVWLHRWKFPFMKLVMFRLCGSAFIRIHCWTWADRAVRIRTDGLKGNAF